DHHGVAYAVWFVACCDEVQSGIDLLIESSRRIFPQQQRIRHGLPSPFGCGEEFGCSLIFDGDAVRFCDSERRTSDALGMTGDASARAHEIHADAAQKSKALFYGFRRIPPVGGYGFNG